MNVSLTWQVVGSQSCLAGGRDGLLGPLLHGGVLDAVIATLKHESPFCVAAAAAVLYCLGSYPGGRQALGGASDLIPALVHAMARQFPPPNPEQEVGLFRRCACNHANLHVSAYLDGSMLV